MSQPATLDGQKPERVELQQAVVAANAVEDASRRTWTQARQLMNEWFSDIVDTTQRMLTDHSQVICERKGKGKGKYRGTSAGKGTKGKSKEK